MEFHNYIKNLRKQKKLSLKEVAKRGGLSHSYLSQLENNKRKPKPDMLKKLSDGLDHPYIKLLEAAGFYDEEKTEILSDTKKIIDGVNERSKQDIEIIFRYPKYVWENISPFENVEKELSFEEAKIHFLSLENLLTMNEKLYFNKKELSKEEREKILQIVNLVLNDEKEQE